MAKNTNDEIIEKRESNPVATASIVLSTLAILFAIAFSMMEIAQYRTNLSVTGDRPGKASYTRDSRRLKDQVAAILAGEDSGSAGEDDDEAAADDDDDDEADEGGHEDDEEEEEEEEA